MTGQRQAAVLAGAKRSRAVELHARQLDRQDLDVAGAVVVHAELQLPGDPVGGRSGCLCRCPAVTQLGHAER